MKDIDKTAVGRILSGDTKAFGQLVKDLSPVLMMFVGRIVEQQEDTEDVVQNTFLAAFRHLKDYDPEKASLQTWLQRIAYHEALYHLRRHRKRQTLSLDVSDDVPDEWPETTTVDQLDEAIRQLSPEDQMLLQLYYFDQRPLKDIAFITGATDATLSREASRLGSRLHRIRQRLRILLIRMNNE